MFIWIYINHVNNKKLKQFCKRISIWLKLSFQAISAPLQKWAIGKTWPSQKEVPPYLDVRWTQSIRASYKKLNGIVSQLREIAKSCEIHELKFLRLTHYSCESIALPCSTRKQTFQNCQWFLLSIIWKELSTYLYLVHSAWRTYF